MDYSEFIQSKQILHPDCGIDITKEKISRKLFPFQRDICYWALRKGRAAIFADCGLGKTVMQIEWARRIGGPGIILAPLAVNAQTVTEAQDKLHVQITNARGECEEEKLITNYEMMQHFNFSRYRWIVLDESSILKNFSGHFRNEIINATRCIPFRLACTATPSPNDIMELGNHSEFLGNLSRTEMLATFFVHDGGDTGKWRLKGHAKKDFWRWVCSWAVMLRKPSDLGYSDEGFILPELRIHEIVIDCDDKAIMEDDVTKQITMFPGSAKTLGERRAARSETIVERAEVCYKLINEQRRKASIQQSLPPKAQREVERSGKDLVLDERRQDRQKLSQELHEDLPSSKHGQMEEDARAAGQSKLGSPEKIREGSSIPGSYKSKSERVANVESREEEKPETSQNSRYRHTGLSGHVGDSGEPLCDMRLLRHEQSQDVSVCRPLPQEGYNSGSSLYELQSGSREVQGQSGSAFYGGDVPATKFLIWCNLNDEQDEIERLFGEECISIYGSLSSSEKESRLNRWLTGDVPVLVTKTSIIGFGLNLQVCHKAVFLGLSDSFESYYQAVRRVWRFGQKHPVDCYIVTSSLEGEVVKNIKRKEKEAQEMAAEMVENMSEINKADVHGNKRQGDKYETAKTGGNDWGMHLGDNQELLKDCNDDSIHYVISSWPFESLYTYSASERDVGNCRNRQEFWQHMSFLIPEMFRVLKPGRLMSVHCMDLPTSKERDGYIGINDFSGETIRACVAAGFIYHSRVVIWKNPVTAMQRTKALGLLHKQVKKDSCMSRQGIPDYLLTFRKPGENQELVTGRFEEYIGEDGTGPGEIEDQERKSIEIWQRYASPVWMDIDASNTLQRTSARENEDERHIAPLQLQVIERGLELWTNPGDIVFDPFTGIGSSGYVALKMGRKFLGVDLKKSYYEQACRNLKNAEMLQADLFAQPELEITEADAASVTKTGTD